jgi:curli production assembly/transport component CsgF
MRKTYLAIPAVIALVAGASATAFASEMVYHPVIPAFGGNPLNGSTLLSTAQAQGEGVKSGPQGPDLSGLNNALSNPIIIGGAGNNGSGGGGSGSAGSGSGGSGSGGSGSGGSSGGSGAIGNSMRAIVP